MIHVKSVPLPDSAQTKLDEYQSEVNQKPTYKEKVFNAKSSFKSRNKKANKTFQAVKKGLDEMCSGARRCHYCEDSAADEVEHFYPKDIYPQNCFLWSNYLYSCGRCNGTHKNNKFKIFVDPTREIKDITPTRRNRIYKAPSLGDPLLLDPRQVDPMDYIILELSTLIYVEKAPEGTEEFKRGKYTIELLGLNSRSVLVDSRVEAYESYIARLDRYCSRKEQFSAIKLNNMKQGIQHMSHPTVWKEMQRQHKHYPELKELFEESPEALSW